MNIKPTWTCFYNHLTRAIWRWLECANMLEREVVMYLLCCGARVRLLTLINGDATPMQTLLEHQWCSFWWKWNIFWCSCKHVLHAHVNSIIQLWTLFEFLRNSCDYVARSTGQCTYPHIPHFKVDISLWVAQFGMRICGGARLLGCSHQVDHTISPLIF